MKSIEEIDKGGIFTTDHRESGELTHRQLELYISEARRRQSLYTADLLRKLKRQLGAGCIRLATRFGAAGRKIRVVVAMGLRGLYRFDLRYGACRTGERKMPGAPDAKCA